MTTFFEQLGQLDKTQRNVAAVIIDGELTGARAIYNAAGYLYCDAAQAAIWSELAPLLAAVDKPKTLQISGVKIFAEVLWDIPQLIVCGGGHISLPVVQLAKMIGFQVSVIDDRSFFANATRFPQADSIYCEEFTAALAKIPDNAGNYFVIVSRGHTYDQACLRAIVNRPAAYIGMIGSRSRVRLVKESLLEEGFAEERLNSVHTPIGLKIGAETPEEIAISILAEIISVKNAGHSGGGYEPELLAAILAAQKNQEAVALVTLTARRGSAPRAAGTKMLVHRDGHCIGTIGGGCVESNVHRAALSALDGGEYRRLQVDMTGKDAEDEGMVCGGLVNVLIEPLQF